MYIYTFAGEISVYGGKAVYGLLEILTILRYFKRKETGMHFCNELECNQYNNSSNHLTVVISSVLTAFMVGRNFDNLIVYD